MDTTPKKSLVRGTNKMNQITWKSLVATATMLAIVSFVAIVLTASGIAFRPFF